MLHEMMTEPMMEQLTFINSDQRMQNSHSDAYHFLHWYLQGVKGTRKNVVYSVDQSYMPTSAANLALQCQ